VRRQEAEGRRQKAGGRRQGEGCTNPPLNPPKRGIGEFEGRKFVQ